MSSKRRPADSKPSAPSAASQSAPSPSAPSPSAPSPSAPPSPTPAATAAPEPTRSRGFWAETWSRFRRQKLSMLALAFIVFLSLTAVFSPAIVGTKPIVCRYKGSLYFPALGYFFRSWENPIFFKDSFYRVYPKNLKEKDPESWAIWPLIYQDPLRRIKPEEWPGQPGNENSEPPNKYNLMGTDNTGRDVLARMVHGTQIALLVGFVSTGISALIGIVLGALGGYLGGWADMLLSRLTEVVMCIPSLVLILALMAIIEKPTIWHMMAVLGATGWTGIARLTRGEFLKLKQGEFVMAARALGVGQLRIIFRHVLPNSLAPVLVPISFGIASAILVESSLSFLGFGTPPPTPSWGTILNNGKENLRNWWLIIFPGSAIFLVVLAYNLIGEGLQEATDPRLREAGK